MVKYKVCDKCISFYGFHSIVLKNIWALLQYIQIRARNVSKEIEILRDFLRKFANVNLQEIASSRGGRLLTYGLQSAGIRDFL